MFGSNTWAATIGPLCRVPVTIAHEHNWSYSGNRLRIWFDGHWIGRRVTRFIAVSEANRARMIELEGVPPGKIEVMPTAYIPSPAPQRHPLRARHRSGGAAHRHRAHACDRRRRSMYCSRPMPASAIGCPGSQLVIAGAGPCLQALEALAARLGTTDSVHFLGERFDVDSVLRGLDAGVMSSDWEGMPLFVFECMAASTPLVATSSGDCPRSCAIARRACWSRPATPRRSTDALAELLDDRRMAGELAAAAAALRLPEFSIDAVAERFADLYARLRAEAAAR